MESQTYQEAGAGSGSLRENDVSVPSTSAAVLSLLPAEMLDEIFDFLRDDRKTLLKCRQINSYWRDAMDSYLERNILYNWTNWVPSTKVHLFQPFPILPLVPFQIKGHSSTLFNFAYCPKGLLSQTVNPFPTRSLTFCNLLEKVDLEEDNDIVGWMDTDQLLRLIGVNLTSFVLHDSIVAMSQLENIAESLVNLKVLSFSKVKLREEIPCEEIVITPKKIRVSSKLTHFQAVQEVTPKIVEWIIPLCSQQLISLEVDGSRLKPLEEHTILDQLETPDTSSFFKELKYLKIYNPSLNFLEGIEPFGLKYLSIICKEKERDIFYVLEVSNFVEKFSSTLIHLHLDVNFRVGLELREIKSRSIERELQEVETFPNLIQFDFRYPFSVISTGSAGILLRRHFLPKFPFLEKLHLLPPDGAEEDLSTQTTRVYAEPKQEYIKLCPKLKSIR